MQSADERIESYRNYPIPSEKLRAAMLWVAEVLCDEMIDAEHATAWWSMGDFQPSQCRAICEHLAAGRVYLICEDFFLPGQFQLEPGKGLAEWWCEVSAKIKPKAENVKQQGKQGTTGGASLDARALAVFIEHTEWTKKEIAKHLSCNEKSLAPRRCPKLDAAIRAHKASLDPSRRVVRGAKDPDGNLDGYVE